MSERPRARLFSAKPDDVFLQSLCSWVAATAPPTMLCPNEVITPVTKLIAAGAASIVKFSDYFF